MYWALITLYQINLSILNSLGEYQRDILMMVDGEINVKNVEEKQQTR
jgi:hypothetical protein